jgi:hypothetical protein
MTMLMIDTPFFHPILSLSSLAEGEIAISSTALQTKCTDRAPYPLDPVEEPREPSSSFDSDRAIRSESMRERKFHTIR